MTQTAVILGWLVLGIGVPVNVWVVLRLRTRSRARPDLGVLRERYRTAKLLLAWVFVFGLIFVNNDQPIPPLDVDTTKLITRTISAALALAPAIGWLWLYRSTRRTP